MWVIMYIVEYGLATPMNTVSSFLMKENLAERVVKKWQDSFKVITSHLDPVPSLVLELLIFRFMKWLEHLNICEQREYILKPIYITRIEDKDGNVDQRSLS